jgi:hypothetical protein
MLTVRTICETRECSEKWNEGSTAIGLLCITATVFGALVVSPVTK